MIQINLLPVREAKRKADVKQNVLELVLVLIVVFAVIGFAHTDLSGMALFEEAQYWGVRAAEAVMREQRHAFQSWLV